MGLNIGKQEKNQRHKPHLEVTVIWENKSITSY